MHGFQADDKKERETVFSYNFEKSVSEKLPCNIHDNVSTHDLMNTFLFGKFSFLQYDL